MNQTYEQKKHERTEEKEYEQRNNRRGRAGRKFRNVAIAFFILGVIGYGVYLIIDSQVPKSEDFSQAIEVMGADHIQVGSSHESYNSNPPTSGWHYASTAENGFYDLHDGEKFTDEYIVHNLEHGDIWISYNPRIGDEVAHALKQFAGQKVIITPREANDTDIALAAWGRLDAFNLEGNAVPVERISDFILRYQNKGPEKVL